MIGRAVIVPLLAAAALFAGPPARGQDLSARKGFSIRIVEPKASDVIYGEVTIRAEVTARREDDVARVDFFLDDKLVLSDNEPPYVVVHDFGRKSASRVIRAVAHHREGPTVSDFLITKAIDLQYVVNVQRVVLDVSVRDEQRRVVTGLGVADFSVVEEKRPQKVTSVSPDRRPLLVGMLLDSSGSMRARISQAQDAACAFIATLEENDRAFVVDFDEQVTLVEEISSDTNLLCRAIRRTTAIGGTALYEAIHASYRVLHETPADRRALVLLSDGEDSSSRISFDDVLVEARLNDVTVYVIGLDVGGGTARSVLERLAEETGGRSFFIRDSAELEGTYGVIAEELRTRYQVVYASDNEKFDGRFMPISVSVRGGRRWDVRHRSGYHAIEPD